MSKAQAEERVVQLSSLCHCSKKGCRYGAVSAIAGAGASCCIPFTTDCDIRERRGKPSARMPLTSSVNATVLWFTTPRASRISLQVSKRFCPHTEHLRGHTEVADLESFHPDKATGSYAKRVRLIAPRAEEALHAHVPSA